jgi:5'-nucleotidase
MKLLLTNDDGLFAPGIAALAVAAAPLGELVFVAPAEECSSCSHRVTTGKPLAVLLHGEQRYAVQALPADCVRIAKCGLAADCTAVLSGINYGGNLGADVYISGTVAAVREAALLGWPGIALSHYVKRGQPVDWDRAARWVTPVVRDLLARPHTPGHYWSVNLPHLGPDDPEPQVVVCPLDPNPLPVHFTQLADGWKYDGNYHQRPRRVGSDIDVCFGGNIAVTELVLHGW